MKRLLAALLLGTAVVAAYSARAATPNQINGCQYLTTLPTLTNGQTTVLHCDVNGKILTSGSSARTPLTADLNLDVFPGNVGKTPAPNDNSNCLAPNSCATINGAIAKRKNYDTKGFNVFIHIHGFSTTYNENVLVDGPNVGNGLVVLDGENDSGTGATIDANNAGASVTGQNGAQVFLEGVNIQNSSTGQGVLSQYNAWMEITNTIFGNVGGEMIHANASSEIFLQDGITISGNATSALHATAQGFIGFDNRIITCTGSPAFSAYFAGLAGSAYIEALGSSFSGCSTVTGEHFSMNHNSSIRTGTNNIAFFPGNLTGVAQSSSAFDDWGTIGYLSTVAALSSGPAQAPCDAFSSGIALTITDALAPTYLGTLTGGSTVQVTARCHWNTSTSTGTWLSE